MTEPILEIADPEPSEPEKRRLEARANARAKAKLKKHPMREDFGLTGPQLQMLTVPPDANPSLCPRCGASVYLMLVNGRSVMVDCRGKEGMVPKERVVGRGISHLGTGCPGVR